MHPFDQPEVVAGQGTIAAELADQVHDVETVLVAIGGGGLIGGIAAWEAGRVRVVGVEPDTCPTMSEALRVGRPTPVEVGGLRGRLARIASGRRRLLLGVRRATSST